MVVLPVLVGIWVADFLNDIYRFRLKGPDHMYAVVELFDKTIVDSVKLNRRTFISHRHKDEPIVAALTRLREQAFYVDSNDIRCTSVQPYILTSRERTSELFTRRSPGPN